MRWLILPLLLVACSPEPAKAETFDLPIACAVGADCVVQNYVDIDAGAGWTDPMCGPLSYNDHDGLDFRVTTAAAQAGVRVLAPMAGVVRGVRDGEADGLLIREGQAALQGRDCGNGVRIEHTNGWSTQLCHMRNGSVRVREGETVTAGQELGLVGLSGYTEFPHLHIALERNGETLDPLTGAPIATLRCGVQEAALPGAHWSDAARAQLSYTATRIFMTGFTANEPQDGGRIEELPANASANGAVLIYWALTVGPREGDLLSVKLYGPDGALLSEGERTQPRSQAQASVFAGRRTPQGGWPPGMYRGEATLTRDGRMVTTHSEMVDVR